MNTKILTLLAAVLIYYTLSSDIEEQNLSLIREIQMIEHKMGSPEDTRALMKKTQTLVKLNRSVAQYNDALFVDSALPDALAYAALQQNIRDDASASEVELTNLSWGEPSQKEQSPYTLLPLSIAFKGEPAKCADFLRRLRSHGQLVTVENLSIVQYQNALSIVADLYGYRMDDTDNKSEGTR